jgi:hypothetical protein
MAAAIGVAIGVAIGLAIESATRWMGASTVASPVRVAVGRATVGPASQ